jgi:hypothetical protein
MQVTYDVPDEFDALGRTVEEIHAVLHAAFDAGVRWTPDSQAAREVALVDDFADLPFENVVATALIHPQTSLGQSRDHLAGFAADIRAPYTSLSLLTLLRPLLVGAGMTYYVADPSINVKERVRRALNIELSSALELMHYFGSGTEGYAKLERRRVDITKAAKKHWPHVTTTAARKGSTTIPDWYIGDAPLGDMAYVRQGLSSMQSGSQADQIYRLLSAPTHAQPHALLAFLRREDIVAIEVGFAIGAVGMSMRLLVTLTLVAVLGLTAAFRRCCALYGWDGNGWESIAVPRAREWITLLERDTRQQFTQRTGLILPPL